MNKFKEYERDYFGHELELTIDGLNKETTSANELLHELIIIDDALKYGVATDKDVLRRKEVVAQYRKARLAETAIKSSLIGDQGIKLKKTPAFMPNGVSYTKKYQIVNNGIDKIAESIPLNHDNQDNNRDKRLQEIETQIKYLTQELAALKTDRTSLSR